MLLCTDGLTDVVDDETIEAILGTAASPSYASRELIDCALDRDPTDNITALVYEHEFDVPHETLTDGYSAAFIRSFIPVAEGATDE